MKTQCVLRVAACVSVLSLILPAVAQTGTADAVLMVTALQRQVNEAVNENKDLRIQALTGKQIAVEPVLVGDEVDQQEAERTAALQAWKALHTEDYSAIRIESAFTPQLVVAHGQFVTLTGDETVHIFLTVKDNGRHDFSPDKQAFMQQLRREHKLYEAGDTVNSSYRVHHTYRLVRSAAHWKIVQDVSDEVLPASGKVDTEPLSVLLGLVVSPTLSVASSLSAGIVKEDAPAPGGFDYSTMSSPAVPALNRRAVALYADKYCNEGPNKVNGYNKKYTSYVGQSADCANFVSQCYGDSEGGNLPTSNDWRPYTTKWIRAKEFFDYMKGYVGFTWGDYMDYNTAKDFQRRYLYQGDLICFYKEKSHVVVVVAYDRNGNCFYDGHTNDRYHALWDQFAGPGNQFSMLHVR